MSIRSHYDYNVNHSAAGNIADWFSVHHRVTHTRSLRPHTRSVSQQLTGSTLSRPGVYSEALTTWHHLSWPLNVTLSNQFKSVDNTTPSERVHRTSEWASVAAIHGGVCDWVLKVIFLGHEFTESG